MGGAGLYSKDDFELQANDVKGWLFLFAVLMAAALLFCMVFFVRVSLTLQLCMPTIYRSSCSQTWNATTLIL